MREFYVGERVACGIENRKGAVVALVNRGLSPECDVCFDDNGQIERVWTGKLRYLRNTEDCEAK